MSPLIVIHSKKWATLGIGLITFGSLANPWVLAWLFSPDGRIDARDIRAGILVAEVFLICWGLITIQLGHKAWVRETTLVVISLLILCPIVGELFFRTIFFSGASFDSHYGPIVARLERDFVFNGYDGPSRGPSAADQRRPGQVRILIQGDSITWGQGIRDEKNLFTSRLLDILRREGRDVEMAVLAKPGREIDGHIEQLIQWGQAIDPEVIVYVWYVNDVELDKSERPVAPGRYWRHLSFHPLLATHSYLWFFLDYSLDQLLPKGPVSYESYLTAQSKPGTIGWTNFIAAFEQWLTTAKSLSPRVMVVLYPSFDKNGTPLLQSLSSSFEEVAKSDGVDVLDLGTLLATLARSHQLYVSRFDAHPGEAAHAVIAESLSKRFQALHWLDR